MHADGLDVPRLFYRLRGAAAALAEYQDDGVVRLEHEELLTQDVDVLVPAALGEVLTEQVAKDLRARMVVEAANGPTVPEADEILAHRGIAVLPDILANAGGVTVSYFEWAQNIQCMRWTEEEVNRRLEQVMLDSYRTVRGLVEQRNADMAHRRVRRRAGPGGQGDRSPRGVRGMSIDPADARAFPGFAHLDDRSVDDLRALSGRSTSSRARRCSARETTTPRSTCSSRAPWTSSRPPVPGTDPRIANVWRPDGPGRSSVSSACS